MPLVFSTAPSSYLLEQLLRFHSDKAALVQGREVMEELPFHPWFFLCLHLVWESSIFPEHLSFCFLLICFIPVLLIPLPSEKQTQKRGEGGKKAQKAFVEAELKCVSL